MRITKTDIPNARHNVDLDRAEIEAIEVQRAIALSELYAKYGSAQGLILDKGDRDVVRRALHCYVEGFRVGLVSTLNPEMYEPDDPSDD